MSEAKIITRQLLSKHCNREDAIDIIDELGDPIDWGVMPYDEVIGAVMDSDVNSGDDPEGWVINAILREYGLKELDKERA